MAGMLADGWVGMWASRMVAWRALETVYLWADMMVEMRADSKAVLLAFWSVAS